MKRNIGDIYFCNSSGRKMIKTEQGRELYAVYVAKNNPNICGKWFEGCEVHHIDGNKTNDIPDNLLCLPPLVHHQLHTKRVVGFYKGIVVDVYKSATEASEKTSCPISAISYYCKYNKPISGTFKDWSFRYI